MANKRKAVTRRMRKYTKATLVKVLADPALTPCRLTVAERVRVVWPILKQHGLA